MKRLPVAFGVLGLLISFVQAYRLTQTLDDLMVRDLIDELELGYQSARSLDYDAPGRSFSERELLDALTLRDFEEYGRPVRRHKSGDAIDSDDEPAGGSDPIEVTIAVGEPSENKKYTVKVNPNDTVLDLKKKLLNIPEYVGPYLFQLEIYNGGFLLPDLYPIPFTDEAQLTTFLPKQGLRKKSKKIVG